MEYEVIRKGKCPACDQESEYSIGSVMAYNPEEAITIAIDNYIYDRFGQAGAVRPKDLVEEEEFTDAKFEAKEVK